MIIEPRIRNNIQLLGRLDAVIHLLENKQRYLRESRFRLGFLNRQAEDDLMIMNTVSHMAVDALLTEIDSAVETIEAATKSPLVDLDRLAPESPEEAWRRLLVD